MSSATSCMSSATCAVHAGRAVISRVAIADRRICEQSACSRLGNLCVFACCSPACTRFISVCQRTSGEWSPQPIRETPGHATANQRRGGVATASPDPNKHERGVCQ